jgi:hypothetical protein
VRDDESSQKRATVGPIRTTAAANERPVKAHTLDGRQKARENADLSKPVKAQHLGKLAKGLKNH